MSSYTYGINLDFHQVNYTQDLSSLLLFSSLESTDFVGCTNSTKRWDLSCQKHQCRNLDAYSSLKGIQKSGLVIEITI